MIGLLGGNIGKWSRHDIGLQLVIDQQGASNVLELRDDGIKVFSITEGGRVSLPGIPGTDPSEDNVMWYDTNDNRTLKLSQSS